MEDEKEEEGYVEGCMIYWWCSYVLSTLPFPPLQFLKSGLRCFNVGWYELVERVAEYIIPIMSQAVRLLRTGRCSSLVCDRSYHDCNTNV